MKLDEHIKRGYFRRAGDTEGFLDEATGEHGFRSAALGIEVRGATYEEAEVKFNEALRAHPKPASAFRNLK